MRPSYIPRPKPTWLDWLVLTVSIVGVVSVILVLAGLGHAMPDIRN